MTGVGQGLAELRRTGFADGPSFAQAQADLSSKMGTKIGEGELAVAGGDYPGAITIFKQAGDLGAQQIGPEIDNAGAPQVTQSFTQQAWSLNGALAAISGSDLQAAQSAMTTVGQMYGLYQSAITAGLAATTPVPGPKPPPPGPKPPPAPQPGAQPSDYGPWPYIGAAAVGAAILLWAAWPRLKKLPAKKRAR